DGSRHGGFPRPGEQVVAVLRTPRADPRLTGLPYSYLRNRLVPCEISARWLVTAEFPVTPTADIDGRRRLLRRRFAEWRPRTLSDWLDNCAQRHGERPMVLTDDRELSYADIAAESHRLADGLAAIGVRPGNRVAMVMANYPEFVSIKFAIARAGAVAV